MVALAEIDVAGAAEMPQIREKIDDSLVADGGKVGAMAAFSANRIVATRPAFGKVCGEKNDEFISVPFVVGVITQKGTADRKAWRSPEGNGLRGSGAKERAGR